MTAREYLNHIKTSVQTFDALYRRLEEIRTRIEGVKGIAYDKVRVQTSPKNETENLIAELIDAESKLSKEAREHFDEVIECAVRIYKLPSHRQARVLELRYISGMSWQKIADELGIEYRSATRIHGKALRNFEKMYGGVLEVSHKSVI